MLKRRQRNKQRSRLKIKKWNKLSYKKFKLNMKDKRNLHYGKYIVKNEIYNKYNRNSLKLIKTRYRLNEFFYFSTSLPSSFLNVDLYHRASLSHFLPNESLSFINNLFITSSGSSGLLVRHFDSQSLVKLPSGLTKLFPSHLLANRGPVSLSKPLLPKAGSFSLFYSSRPRVRRKAKNPCDRS